MQSTAQQQRSWQGAVLLSRGVRPFFLAAVLWAMVALAVWLPLCKGAIATLAAFSLIDWHIHEMIFGYGAAVVAGCLGGISTMTPALPGLMMPLLYAALVSWICAFFGFNVIYGPMLALQTSKRH